MKACLTSVSKKVVDELKNRIRIQSFRKFCDPWLKLFENTYQMTPSLIFNGKVWLVKLYFTPALTVLTELILATLAEEKVVEVVDAFAAKYYIRSDAVQGQ